MHQELHEPREDDQAEVKMGELPLDDEVGDLLDDDTLNQQVFSEWNYSQRFRAMQTVERMIKENSRQGKRSDLIETQVDDLDEAPPADSRHKLGGKSRRATTRDRIADRLGIATATLSKYRSISRLPDDLIDALGRMVDDRRITFEAAYRMSTLKSSEIRVLVGYIDQSPDQKIDLDKLKELCTEARNKKGKLRPNLPKAVLGEVLIPKEPRTGKIKVVHRNQ